MADDAVFLDVLPSLATFKEQLAKQAPKAAEKAGQQAGKAYSGAFEDGADGAGDAAVKELEAAEKRTAGLMTKLSGDVSKARQNMNRTAAGQLTAETRLQAAIERYGEDSNQAKAASLNLAAAREKAQDAATAFEHAEDGLREAHKAHKTVVEQLKTAQDEATTSAEQGAKAQGKVGGVMDTVRGKVKGFTGGLGGMVTKMAAVAGGAKLMWDAFDQAKDMQNVGSLLTAQLGATPAQAQKYGDAAGKLYAQAYGENLDEVSESVDAVVSSIAGMRDASQKDIEKVTGYAMNLAAAFDVDVSESASAAGTMIKNGLAKDGTAAFDQMTGAMQKMPKGVRGEVLPAMSEYAKHFGALGISGESAMLMLAKGSQDGAIGVDKVGDALKEFTIRGTDMSKSTMGAYDTLGLNSEKITKDLLAGGKRASGAMGTVVTALQKVKDPATKANTALALFGTPLEDLGTDQIPGFLKMINPATQQTGKFAGKAKEVADSLHSGVSNNVDTLKRSFMGMLTKGITPLIGPLTSFLAWAKDTPGVLQGVGVALGVVAAAWTAVTLAASPWLALGVGIALVIGGIIVVIRNWGKIWGWLKTNVIAPFIAWITPAWNAVAGFFRATWTNVLRPVFTGIGAIAKWLWGNVLKPTFNVLRTAFKIVAVAFLAYYTYYVKPMFTAFAAIGKWLWTNVLRPVFGWIGDRFKVLVTGLKAAYTLWVKPTFQLFGQVAKWLWTNVVRPVFGWIGDKWRGMVSGIKSVYDRYLKPVFSTLADVVSKTIPAAFRAGKDAIGKAWKKIEELARKPVQFVVDTVYNKGIRPLWNKVTGVFGGDELPEFKFASGGVMPGYTPGRDVHHFQSATGGSLHLSGGEAIMRPEVTRAYGTGWVNRMNAAARSGGVAGVRRASDADQFANGGIFRPIPSTTYTSGFGVSRYGSYHIGEDIATPDGTTVRAALPGKVEFADWNYSGGGTTHRGMDLVLGHASGIMRTLYGHLSRFLVGVGDQVQAGQPVALSGHTGGVGPHLHFETWVGGRPVDPMPYLSGAGVPAGSGGDTGGGGSFFDFSGVLAKFGKIKDGLSAIGDTGFGRLIKSGATKMINGPIQKVKDFMGGAINGVKDAATSVYNSAGVLAAKAGVRTAAAGHGGLFGNWATGAQWKAIDQIVSHESSWNVSAQNPKSSAFGLFQLLDSNRGGSRSINPLTQGRAGLNYIAGRYGDPVAAWDFWQKHHWYKDGGVLPEGGHTLYDTGGWLQPGTTQVLNKTGRPEPVFTAIQWKTLSKIVAAAAQGHTAGGDTYEIHAESTDSAQELVDAIAFATRRTKRK